MRSVTARATASLICGRVAAARALVGILSLAVIYSVLPRPIAANEPGTEETSIPVATAAGVVCLSQRQYDDRIRAVGHLPLMTRSYVFGHTIPMPKTDKFGYIHLSHPDPVAPHGAHHGNTESRKPERDPARPPTPSMGDLQIPVIL